MLSYIYLIREREFIRLKERTYKIGRTTQKPIQRFKQYPKGSELLLFIRVDNVIKTENHLIQVFKKHFQHMSKYGNEYFNGNYKAMLMVIFIEIIHKGKYQNI